MAKPKKDRSRNPAKSSANATTPSASETAGDPPVDRPAPKRKKRKKARRDGTRETVESIVVAFILAFLFRTFEAEAFVIPTGSMAPTLYGRHKDVTCPKCGTHFTIGASDEVRVPPYPDDQYLNPAARIHTAFCPNCRYEVDVEETRVFTGDRILVNKWPYEFGSPARWDVVVFKFPEDPKTNYIKRLVGLPGEELRIERGNVFVRSGEGWEILRKENPNKQRELQLLVYDDRHPPTELIEAGWPERWGPVAGVDERDIAEWTDDPNGWKSDSAKRVYEIDADGNEFAWLRYRHFLPSPDDWKALPDVDTDPAPQLVTDFLAYNSYTGGAAETVLYGDRFFTGYWVGDLTLESRVRVERAEGTLMFELNHGYRRYRCTIDLATGNADLLHLEEGLDREAAVVTPMAKATTRLRSPGTYRVAFANVDRRLVLWINGAIVKFDGATTYKAASLPGPHPRDLAPAGIAARGTHVKVDRLKLFRDVYYRAEQHTHNGTRGESEVGLRTMEQLSRLRSDPLTWAEMYDGTAGTTRAVQFDALGDDEFFMLGDNSARSQDSRLWDNGGNPQLTRERRHSVPRSALVGKAFYVYWPHGVPFLNDGRGYSGFARHIPLLNRFVYHSTPPTRDQPSKITDYPRMSFPFYPQFGRMSRIR